MTSQEHAHRVVHYAITPSEAGRMLEPAVRRKRVSLCQPLAGGQSNTTYRVTLEGLDCPFVLRIYTREAEVRLLEQRICAFASEAVRAPEMLLTRGAEGGIPAYAVLPWYSGATLETALAGGLSPQACEQLGGQVAGILVEQHHWKFSGAGVLTADLSVGVFEATRVHPFAAYALECLDGEAGTVLGPERSQRVREVVSAHAGALPDLSEASLVHGDFRPANILVDLSGPAQVQVVLDWEFAYSASPLCDIGAMLRFPERDVEALSQAVASLLADPARWLTIGEAGRARVEAAFNIHHINKRLAELFESAA